MERRPDPADRRSVTVRPAPGRAADIVAALAPLDAAIGGLLSASSPGERAAIGRFLNAAGRAVADETARLRAGTRGGFVGDTFQAPLGGAARGRLVFASGAPRLALNIAPLGPRASARIIAETSASRLEFAGAAPVDELVVASFDGPRPDVRSGGGVVTIRYRRHAIAAFATRRARIALQRRGPVDARARRRDHRPDGLARRRHAGATRHRGGANHLNLDLPRPHGTAARAPERRGQQRPVPTARGCARRGPARGRRLRLQVDGRSRVDVAGKRRYVGDGFDERPDRYELEILGGASEVDVSER